MPSGSLQANVSLRKPWKDESLNRAMSVAVRRSWTLPSSAPPAFG